LSLSPAGVDVTKADRQVQVSVHLHDDTGVAQASAALFAGDQYTPYRPLHLTSGTVRDGVWSGPITVHRFALPGSFYIGIDVTDRVGREYEDANPQQHVTVTDSTPDTQPPVVRSVSVPSAAIDTRTADSSVTFTAHITDDAAGVEKPGAIGCIYAPGVAPEWVQTRCVTMIRSKGTATDGTWKVTVPLPKNSIAGTWNVGVWVLDVLMTHGEHYYLGTDMYHWQQVRNAGYPTNPNEHELAGARFAVLGTADTHPPRLKTVKVNHTSVDTLTSDQTVDMYVHAQDAKGEGVTDLQIYINAVDPANAGVRPQISAASLYQGDAVDGWWKVQLVFPRGTPPGQYRLDYVSVRDRLHNLMYAAVPQTGGMEQKAYPAGSLVTTSGAAWDGIITVVANPAG
jgi:hypothetical protein